MSELPFANSSLNSSLDSNADNIIASITISSQEEETDGFQSCIVSDRSSKAMLFCHLNVQSLLSKMDECRQFIQDTGKTLPLIFGMSETWLTESVTDGEVAVEEYTLYRRDHGSRGHGGVLLYVPNVIRSFRRPDLERDGIEAVWVELRTRVGTILTGVVYRPPEGLASLTKEICGMFEEVAQEGKEVVIMGDFNMNMFSPAASRSPLQTTALECNFRQLITEPTRVTRSSKI